MSILPRSRIPSKVAEFQQKDPRAGDSWSFLKLTQEQREALYYEFLQWQKRRSNVQR
jgi:hypothetical protein